MKKIMFFLFGLMIMSSCVDYSVLNNEPPVVIPTDYFVKVNGLKVNENDTVKVNLNEAVLFEMFDVSGNKVTGVFYSSNLNSSFGTGTIASIQYTETGVYKVRAENGSKVISVYISVSKTTKCILKINDQIVSSGAIFSATTSQVLKFEVVDQDGIGVKAGYDFGDGVNRLVTWYSVSFSYEATGNYNLVINTEDEKITVTMKIVQNDKQDAVMLISSSFSGTTITATLGFRCNAIPDFSPIKTTYVAGETPNASWNKYVISEITTINGVDYFKWNVSVPAGKFRLGWIQQKDASAAFDYNGCNWAYDVTSAYWNGTDYLFYFYLRIVNDKVIISTSAS